MLIAFVSRSLEGFALSIIAFILITLNFLPVQAEPVPISQMVEQEAMDVVSAKEMSEALPSITLKEVAPPSAVQQFREELVGYHPKLNFIGPSKKEVLDQENIELVFDLINWPLSNDKDFGIGPHVVVQVDECKPLRISEQKNGRIIAPLKSLTPGSHRVIVYAAYPWGEAVKEPGASMQLRLHKYKELIGTQPDLGSIWLSPISPELLSYEVPLLIDSIIWNAPIQGLKEGDDQWRLKVTVNGNSFLMDNQEAIWVDGFSSREKNFVQFELLNAFSEAIDPVFNNRILVLNSESLNNKVWTQASLDQEQISSLLGLSQVANSLESSQEMNQMNNIYISEKQE